MSTSAPPPSPRTLRAGAVSRAPLHPVLVRVLARAQATRGRLAFAGAIGALVAFAGLSVNLGDGSRRDVAQVVSDAGFGFVVPVAALLFAVAALGDLVEDGTLVYVWLRPLRRSTLALSATVSSLVVAGPIVVVVLGLTALLAAQPGMLVAVLVAGLLGVAAYASLFVALGVRTTRSLLWGLLYVLLWEGLAAGLSSAFARLSLRRYTTSLFAQLADVRGPRFEAGLVQSIVVLALVSVAAVALCTWFLRTREVP